MPRINALTLDQINRQIDTLDTLQNQVGALQSQSDFTSQQVAINDPIHAPATTNNLHFVWNGGTQTIAWEAGFIKDKNWTAQTLSRPAILSSAPGQQHVYAVQAGGTSLAPSTYYWAGWDHAHQQMVITPNADQIHGNHNVHIICQFYTGTSAQSGSAGGGGSTGGVDLSGSRYKNF